MIVFLNWLMSITIASFVMQSIAVKASICKEFPALLHILPAVTDYNLTIVQLSSTAGLHGQVP
jgi:hypothetical protein